MLVLNRKKGEKIVISDDIFIEVLDVGGGRVSLGIVAPKSVAVNREEVWRALHEAPATE